MLHLHKQVIAIYFLGSNKKAQFKDENFYISYFIFADKDFQRDFFAYYLHTHLKINKQTDKN
jgi:hypothetical protein